MSKYTTCDDVNKMATQKSSQRSTDAHSFAVFEDFTSEEKQRSGKDTVSKVLRSLCSGTCRIGISVRRVDDEMALNKENKKLRGRLRYKVFNDSKHRNEAANVTSNSKLLDFTDLHETSKQNLSSVTTKNNHSWYNKKKFLRQKRKYEIDAKRSYFRKIFSSVLKWRAATSKNVLDGNVKLQKFSFNGGSHMKDKKGKQYMCNDLQETPGTHLDYSVERNLHAVSKNDEPEFAFVDENNRQDEGGDNVSVLNQCFIEDLTGNCGDKPECLNDIYYNGENSIDEENNSFIDDNTFVKLDRIKQMFELNNTYCISEDDFIDSFMRTKLYDSESEFDYSVAA